jgi:hypothetical protein
LQLVLVLFNSETSVVAVAAMVHSQNQQQLQLHPWCLHIVLLGSRSVNYYVKLLLDTSLAAIVMASQAGDHVVYSKFAGTDLDVAGAEHVLLKVRRGAAQQPGISQQEGHLQSQQGGTSSSSSGHAGQLQLQRHLCSCCALCSCGNVQACCGTGWVDCLACM